MVLYCTFPEETAIFRAPDEENGRQLRKEHHHRQCPRQETQRKTTTCLDQRCYRLDRLVDKQRTADGLGSRMLERHCPSCLPKFVTTNRATTTTTSQSSFWSATSEQKLVLCDVLCSHKPTTRGEKPNRQNSAFVIVTGSVVM